MRRYGFVSAGGGEKYSGALKRLRVGDKIAAYSSAGHGYVGYGTVTAMPVPISQFETSGGPLLSQQLKSPDLGHDIDDPALAEQAVAVSWIKAVPLDQAKWKAGLFANQNVVCRLRDTDTIEFLRQEFSVQMAS